MRRDHARICEIFSSLQGEGLRLGERQIFVRFGGCGLRCDYCDEAKALPADSGEEWDARRLCAVLEDHNRRRRHAAVAWTGGEPLRCGDFLHSVLPRVRRLGLKNYLETNGVHVGVLRRLLPWLDMIAVDLKLPSAVGKSLWKAHAEFLRAAGRRAFAKVVLTRSTTDAEWLKVIRLMEANAPSMPLVLQPATPVVSARFPGKRCLPVEPERAVKFLVQARARLKHARLIPQWHTVWRLK
ncbi:MAG: 7-carboxy-7-deazaguanine synthase QueE [Elusimicrobiota bacterium]